MTDSPVQTAAPERVRLRRWRHDDRVPPTLAPDVASTRRHRAFDAQCWSVVTPVVLVGSGALVMSSQVRHQGTIGSALIVTGLIGGSAFGWARAGYWDRALLSMAVRTGTAACTIGLGAGLVMNSNTRSDTAGSLAVWTGVSAIAVETFLDVRHIGRHVRAHGFAHDAQVSLLTPHGPGLAVTLPLR